jgi:hypothetical protein
MLQKALLVLIIAINVYYFLNGSSVSSAPKEPSPVVATKNGKVQGVVSSSRGGRDFFEFLGIPFAKPPVGKLRFEVNLQIISHAMCE